MKRVRCLSKGVFTPSVSTDSCVDALKEYNDFKCSIHTKQKHQHQHQSQKSNGFWTDPTASTLTIGVKISFDDMSIRHNDFLAPNQHLQYLMTWRLQERQLVINKTYQDRLKKRSVFKSLIPYLRIPFDLSCEKDNKLEWKLKGKQNTVDKYTVKTTHNDFQQERISVECNPPAC